MANVLSPPAVVSAILLGSTTVILPPALASLLPLFFVCMAYAVGHSGDKPGEFAGGPYVEGVDTTKTSQDSAGRRADSAGAAREYLVSAAWRPLK